MLRQALIYFILSILVVIFARIAQILIVYLGLLYKWLCSMLIPFFNISPKFFGPMLVKIIILVALPLLVAAIVALIYRLIHKKDFPYFQVLTWCLWLVLTLSSILIRN